MWGTLAVVGWALLYWPSVPASFVYASGTAAGGTNRVLDALYISMVTMSTLGFGDIAPAAGWLRIATPLEALFGFALLTVAVAWVLQIYPALTRRRVLAIRLSSLRRAEVLAEISTADSTMLSGVLERLSTDIIQAQVDLSEYSETYYFRDEDPNASLAVALAYAVELVRIGPPRRGPTCGSRPLCSPVRWKTLPGSSRTGSSTRVPPCPRCSPPTQPTMGTCPRTGGSTNSLATTLAPSVNLRMNRRRGSVDARQLNAPERFL